MNAVQQQRELSEIVAGNIRGLLANHPEPGRGGAKLARIMGWKPGRCRAIIAYSPARPATIDEIHAIAEKFGVATDTLFRDMHPNHRLASTARPQTSTSPVDENISERIQCMPLGVHNMTLRDVRHLLAEHSDVPWAEKRKPMMEAFENYCGLLTAHFQGAHVLIGGDFTQWDRKEAPAQLDFLVLIDQLEWMLAEARVTASLRSVLDRCPDLACHVVGLDDISARNLWLSIYTSVRQEGHGVIWERGAIEVTV